MLQSTTHVHSSVPWWMDSGLPDRTALARQRQVPKKSKMLISSSMRATQACSCTQAPLHHCLLLLSCHCVLKSLSESRVSTVTDRFCFVHSVHLQSLCATGSKAPVWETEAQEPTNSSCDLEHPSRAWSFLIFSIQSIGNVSFLKTKNNTYGL